MTELSNKHWFKVAHSNQLSERGRLHVCIEERYITLFKNKGKITAIDSVCHHAGGPLTEGILQEIEELSLTTVSCPW